MKKLLAVLVIAVSFAACSDNTNADEKATDTIPVAPAPASSIDTSSVVTDTTTVK